jgi:hypothetical protein
MPPLRGSAGGMLGVCAPYVGLRFIVYGLSIYVLLTLLVSMSLLLHEHFLHSHIHFLRSQDLTHRSHFF